MIIWKNWFRNKRRKFLFVTIVLTIVLWMIQSLPLIHRYGAIVGLAVLSYVMTAWSLLSELKGRVWVYGLILPTLYPTMMAFFYFVLPQSLVTRWIVLLLFVISMYALLLTVNIFVVASIRTIQLLRAARAIGLLLSILTSALFYHVIFSLHWSLVTILVSIFVVSFLMLLQGIWSYTLSLSTNKEVAYASVGAMIITQVALGISFWLIDPPMTSVLLAMITYVVMGLFQHEIDERLFERTIQEYIGFALMVVCVVMIVAIIHWTN